MVEKTVIEHQQQNWVRSRAQCTIEYWFDELVKVIQNDVKNFNNLPEEKRQNLGLFRCDLKNKTELEVSEIEEHWRSPLESISVKKNAHEIYIFKGDKVLYKIEPKWNFKTLTCDLIVDKETHPLGELSQMAIGDLLFERR